MEGNTSREFSFFFQIMQEANRNTDLISQAQQILKDADARGIQTLDVISKELIQSQHDLVLLIQVNRRRPSPRASTNTFSTNI